MQKFNKPTTQNRLTRWALRPLLAIAGLCFSQFTAAQSSDINASATFNVPISISCTSNLSFGIISITSTGGIYDSNNKLFLNPITGNTEGELINNNNLLVSNQAFGSCEITGVARGSTLNLGFSTTFASNDTFGSLSSENTDHNLSFKPLMVSANGTVQDGGSTNTIAISTSTSEDDDFGLNNSAYSSGAYAYDNDTDTFTFRIGGELTFGSTLEGVPLAEIAGTYTDVLTVLVEL